MRFSVRVTKSPDKIAALEARLHDLTPAFKRISILVLGAAQGRIRESGPGWEPQAVGPHGETNHTGTLLFRSGALMRSLTLGAAGNEFEDIPGGVRVGTNLTTPGGTYSIGRLMQYGTPPIKPKSGKYLVFEINGQKIFSKGTKGIPKRPFLFVDDQVAGRVPGVVIAYLEGNDAN